MKEFTNFSLENAIIMTKNRYSNLITDIEFDDIKSRIQKMITNDTFRKLIKDSSYTKEQSLIFDGEHKVIDLLIKSDDRYIVIDYKTTAEKSYRHIVQIQKYIIAIKNIAKTNNVDGYILYLSKNNVELLKI